MVWFLIGGIIALSFLVIFWPLPKSVSRYENVTRKPPEKR